MAYVIDAIRRLRDDWALRPPHPYLSPADAVPTIISGGEWLDNWHDGATLVVEAGIPAVCSGPGDIQKAHGVDECVPVADLVACAQGIAVTAMRFCGTAANAAA